ncbi:mitochondrial dimethyladenosine transferase [Acrasis kona]|uniref:rRNA adenine N(6)-methyltransferase n=1 Tax=Acrasis kona TaxID=1008807 RepID=A0AAW2Z9B0_9EUKA
MSARLPPMPSLREILKMYNLQASKQLSQNFLLDTRVTDKIVKQCGDVKDSVVIEVGPGPGPLTRSLINAGARRVIAVEKDERFFPSLQMIGQAVDDQEEKKQKFNLIHGDILEVSEYDLLKEFGEQDTSNVTIIGNLPFGIATPLLIKWLRDVNTYSGVFSKTSKGDFRNINMVLMFQKEVADRICAVPGTKEYSRITICSQSQCTVKNLHTVKAKTFIPAPEVDAGVVKLTPRRDLPSPSEQEHLPFESIEDFCKIAFNGKRKQLNSNLKAVLTPEQIKKFIRNSNLSEKVLDGRVQDLKVDEICQMAKKFTSIQNTD